jgi:hypothetical protein
MKQIAILIGLLFLIILSSSIFARAFSWNEISGEGSVSVSGVVATNIHYHLAKDASKISSVEFELDKLVTTVQVMLTYGNSTWYPCKRLVENQWECTLPGIEVAQANELRIMAAGQPLDPHTAP